MRFCDYISEKVQKSRRRKSKSKTVPTVTQGDVSGLASDAGGHKLFSMSAQIAAGNSGGPAFDDDGK